MPGAAGQAPAASQHVILISIDGFAAFHLNNPALDLPNLRALAAAGVARGEQRDRLPEPDAPVAHDPHHGCHPAPARRRRQHRREPADRRAFSHHEPPSTSVDPRGHAVRRREGVRPPVGGVLLAGDERRPGNRRQHRRGLPRRRRRRSRGRHAWPAPGTARERRADRLLLRFLRRSVTGAGDLALTRAAAYVLAKRRPALTALHLLITDKAQHEFGPSHYLSAAALSTADYCVGVLRQAVRDAGLADRTTFVIGADHGFVTVRDEMNLAPVLADPALDPHIRWRADGWVVAGERLPTFDESRHGPLLDKVLTRVAATPGIRRVVRAEGLRGARFPRLRRQSVRPRAGSHRGGHQPPSRPQSEGRIGHPPAEGRAVPRSWLSAGSPRHVSLLVMSGAGIASGRTIGHVRNVDVAPTIAALLGLALPNVEGRILTEALAAGQKIGR